MRRICGAVRAKVSDIDINHDKSLRSRKQHSKTVAFDKNTAGIRFANGMKHTIKFVVAALFPITKPPRKRLLKLIGV